ncbi:MAG TPA: GNAT family N-acetyltransferase [Thermomicrobiales bacterium]|jgi:GNAT superfamily N-acetyltransferase|nr:GNAT family N-acetyltransferase [Thermomicrobiales bacterium]
MNAEPTTTIRVRPAVASDHAEWDALYAAYGVFYQVTAQDRDLVWGWIMDADHEVNALVAVGPDDRPIGLAHYRPFARPLAAATGCFLDDLFVSPAARGSGAVQQLLAGLRDIARERGWSVVRWITAEDNYRARAVYDRVATRTRWVTYDMEPGETAGDG